MNDLSPANLAQAPVVPASAILAAAGLLLPSLERGQRVDSATLRTAMETAFGASDASGHWTWKAAYDACEAATVLFLRKYGRTIFLQAGAPAARLAAAPIVQLRRCNVDKTVQHAAQANAVRGYR